MSTEKEHDNARGPNGPVKQVAIVLAAVESGHATSTAVAIACGLSLAMASRRLLDLEATGHIERIGVQPRGGEGTRGGGGAIQWRVKGGA